MTVKTQEPQGAADELDQSPQAKASLISKLLWDNPDSLFVQLFRFAIVGGTAFAADFGSFLLTYKRLHMDFRIAGSIGFIFGLLTVYILSVLWVFAKRMDNKAAEFAIFTVIGVIAWVLKIGIMWGGKHVLVPANPVAHHPSLYEQRVVIIFNIIGTGVGAVWNFFSRRWVLFRQKSKVAGPA
jgi:putative flippase GtrA